MSKEFIKFQLTIQIQLFKILILIIELEYEMMVFHMQLVWNTIFVEETGL